MSITSRISGTSRLDLRALRIDAPELLVFGRKAGELAAVSVVYAYCADNSRVLPGFVMVFHR